MIERIQHHLEVMGDWACFELSIMAAAEVERGTPIADVVGQHVRDLQQGWITEKNLVKAAGAIMGDLCGGKWICLKAGDGRDSSGKPYDLPFDYQLQAGEHEILRLQKTDEWEGPGVERSESHFVYGGPGPLWDSFGMSDTRKDGHVVTRRILRKEG